MKQAVKRLTLTGEWQAFTFERKARRYFVKNFTENEIYVSFEANDVEEESFKIQKNHGEEVAISYGGVNARQFAVNTLYVKGTGEVEVEQLDYYGG